MAAMVTESAQGPIPHLCQPLLALCVPWGDQGLLGLMNQYGGALHYIAGRVQHGRCRLGVHGGGGHTAGSLGQSLQGLSSLPCCHTWADSGGMREIQSTLQYRLRVLLDI